MRKKEVHNSNRASYLICRRSILEAKSVSADRAFRDSLKPCAPRNRGSIADFSDE